GLDNKFAAPWLAKCCWHLRPYMLVPGLSTPLLSASLRVPWSFVNGGSEPCRDIFPQPSSGASISACLFQSYPQCRWKSFGGVCQSLGWLALSVKTIELLPRSANCKRAQARCKAQMTGLVELARTLLRVDSSPSPVVPKVRKGLLIPTDQLAPVTILRSVYS